MDNIKDYGQWSTPRSWSDISLKMYSELERLEKKESLIDVIPILCDKTKDEVMALPTEFLDKIIGNLTWMQEPPKFGNPSPSVIIDKQEYRINTESKLKTGELLAVDVVLKNNEANYAAILAILCRKPNEKYDVRFENEVLEDRIKFWESKSILDVMPLVLFFSKLISIYAIITQAYLEAEEALKFTQENIENSRKSGACSVWQSILLKRKLKHLKRSMERTFQRS